MFVDRKPILIVWRMAVTRASAVMMSIHMVIPAIRIPVERLHTRTLQLAENAILNVQSNIIRITMLEIIIYPLAMTVSQQEA